MTLQLKPCWAPFKGVQVTANFLAGNECSNTYFLGELPLTLPILYMIAIILSLSAPAPLTNLTLAQWRTCFAHSLIFLRHVSCCKSQASFGGLAPSGMYVYSCIHAQIHRYISLHMGHSLLRFVREQAYSRWALLIWWPVRKMFGSFMKLMLNLASLPLSSERHFWPFPQICRKCLFSICSSRQHFAGKRQYAGLWEYHS